MLLTPLNNFHKAHNARMVEFGGWEMPIQYSSIIEEHLAVRNAVGLFDVSHMGELLVTGPQTYPFLDSLLTNDFSQPLFSKAKYSPMCYTSGGCVDDLIVYPLDPQKALLCVNASNTQKDFEWLQQNARPWNCQVENVSNHWGQLAVQGPKAIALLQELFPNIADLKRFSFQWSNFENHKILVSRTGYTGEDGAELYCPWTITEKLALAITQKGQPYNLQLAGLGARDSLRLEAQYPLYGHEISETISPLQANLDFAVKLNKTSDFLGKSALIDQQNQASAPKVIYFSLDGRRIAREGALIFSNANQVGHVLSGTHSPTLDCPIGSALIEKSADPSNLEVDIRGNRLPLKPQERFLSPV